MEDAGEGLCMTDWGLVLVVDGNEEEEVGNMYCRNGLWIAKKSLRRSVVAGNETAKYKGLILTVDWHEFFHPKGRVQGQVKDTATHARSPAGGPSWRDGCVWVRCSWARLRHHRGEGEGYERLSALVCIGTKWRGVTNIDCTTRDACWRGADRWRS